MHRILGRTEWSPALFNKLDGERCPNTLLPAKAWYRQCYDRATGPVQHRHGSVVIHFVSFYYYYYIIYLLTIIIIFFLLLTTTTFIYIVVASSFFFYFADEE